MIDIVILNRNLRLHDNAALYYGSLNSNYIVIHLYDEDYWKANGRSVRQLKFSYDCLQELDDNLKKIGSEINIFEGSFNDLKKWIKINFNDCFIHINHCTDIDYFRKGFEKFKQDFRNRLKVYDDFGIQLTDFDRDTWSKNWNHIMFNEHKNKIKSKFTNMEHIQKGGTSVANELLESFLHERCEDYRVKMSSPSLSEDSCSRLSPHFTYGSISIRQVYQKLNDSLPKLENKKDLYSFKKRLYWHCHFVQKLHTEPELEFNSMHRMCDSLRTEHNNEIIEKWIKGETGFPFLDACMKFLDKHGWINFRMRAMIMSFASYNMWQPWQKTSPLLAELFTDYEPGIHISQVQMQSGVTGINLPRIYSVPKQSMDQDPNSEWTKNILPQLDNFEPKFIHDAEFNGAYIPQIVDLKTSAKFARDKIWGIRKSKEFKEEARRVYLKHGSRRKRNVKTN
jgi:deoxyribodipyrimidine photo-lyase